MNLTAVRRELDLAAEELDKKGFKDLADKIDFYNARLQRASAKEIPLIRRALRRVQIESSRRSNQGNPTDNSAARRQALLEKIRSRRARLATPRPRRESSRVSEIREKIAARRQLSLRRALRTKRLANAGREEPATRSAFRDAKTARIRAAIRARRNKLNRQQ